MEKIKNENKLNLFVKTLLVFFTYLFYHQLGSSIASVLNIKYNYIFNFVLDFIFLIGMIITYHKVIKRDYNRLKYRFELVTISRKVLMWVLLLLIFDIAFGYITGVLFPKYIISTNLNVTTIKFDTTWIYTIFKGLVFSVVAEELVFRKSIRDLVKNDKLFIIISSLIYTFISMMYINLSKDYLFLDFISLFIPVVILSTAYVKNKDNLMIDMLIKICYNLILLIVLALQI